MAGASKATVPKENRLFYFPVGKQIKGNYSLVPIVALIGFGIILPTLASFRTIFKSPDVVINKRDKRQYERLVTSEGKAVPYKYYQSKDYSQFDHPERPKLDSKKFLTLPALFCIQFGLNIKYEKENYDALLHF